MTPDRTRPYTYRRSRDTLTRMHALRCGPRQIELAVQTWDLCLSDGQGFLRKFHQALRDGPKRLIIHLSSGPSLSECGATLLAWARKNAEAQGIDFELRPATRKFDAVLAAAGLAA